MREWIVSTLVQIMVCRLFGAKPLSKPMLAFVTWTLRNKLQWYLHRNTKLLIHENTFETSSAKWRPFYPGETESMEPSWHSIHCTTNHLTTLYDKCWKTDAYEYWLKRCTAPIVTFNRPTKMIAHFTPRRSHVKTNTTESPSDQFNCFIDT